MSSIEVPGRGPVYDSLDQQIMGQMAAEGGLPDPLEAKGSRGETRNYRPAVVGSGEIVVANQVDPLDLTRWGTDGGRNADIYTGGVPIEARRGSGRSRRLREELARASREASGIGEISLGSSRRSTEDDEDEDKS